MKKLKFLVGAVALFAVVAVNVWNAATTLRGSELSIADVESTVAEAEPGGQALTNKVWVYLGCDWGGQKSYSTPDGGKVLSTVYINRYRCQIKQNGTAKCTVGEVGEGQAESMQCLDGTGHRLWSRDRNYFPDGSYEDWGGSGY